MTNGKNERHTPVDCIQKDAIGEIRKDVREIRGDMDDVKSTMNGKFEDLRKDTREDNKEVRADIKAVHTRIDETVQAVQKSETATKGEITSQFNTINRNMIEMAEKSGMTRGRLAGLIALVAFIVSLLSVGAGLLVQAVSKGAP